MPLLFICKFLSYRILFYKCCCDVSVLCTIFDDEQVINREACILEDGDSCFCTFVAAVAQEVYRFGVIQCFSELICSGLCFCIFDFL